MKNLQDFPINLKATLIFGTEEITTRIVFTLKHLIVKISNNFFEKKLLNEKLFKIFYKECFHNNYVIYISYNFFSDILHNEKDLINLILFVPKSENRILLIFTDIQTDKIIPKRINSDFLSRLISHLNTLIKEENKLLYENLFNFVRNTFAVSCLEKSLKINNIFIENNLFLLKKALEISKEYYIQSEKDFLKKMLINTSFKNEKKNFEFLFNKGNIIRNFDEDLINMQSNFINKLQEILEIFLLMNIKITENHEKEIKLFNFFKEIKENKISKSNEIKRIENNTQKDTEQTFQNQKKFEINFNLFEEISKEKTIQESNIPENKIKIKSLLLESKLQISKYRF